MADDAGEGKVRVKKQLLIKAIKALAQLVAKRTAANELFGQNGETMVVLFTVNKIPDRKKMKPFMIPLPHPLYDEKSEICFISKDPQKKYKELLLKEHSIPGLTKVIGLDKLRRNYKTSETKRALADSFDLFLCDRNVAEMMHKILGNAFFKKKMKPPLPVKLKPTDPVPNIQKMINGTPFRIPTGSSIGVRFGLVGWPEERLVANAAAVISAVVGMMKDNPLMSIMVQAVDSPALPVWKRKSPAQLLNFKKYHSDASSSAASDAGGHISETEGSSELTSDAGETLSTRDTASELETASELGALDSMSELDSEAGDGDEEVVPIKEELPLVRGLKRGRRRGDADADTSELAESPDDKGKKAQAGEMPPPPAPKKKKKAKVGAK